ncbi:MAG: DNA alkylation repair protein [Clostridia bacterium]|nr:DNA alkylation repair protein [Clostridia bacterium]
MEELRKELFLLQDKQYREFQSRLMPTVDKKLVIGIRIPELRSFAKKFSKTDKVSVFLSDLPHTYYEENNLHAFLIEAEKDYDKCISLLDEFLPYVDNWATCDMMSPKVLGKNRDRLINEIYRWIESGETYTVRYGINLMMKYYLDEAFTEEYPRIVAEVESDDYYVNMMRAWYFATALAKKYDEVLSFITENRLDKWTHNKTIQKAVESYRITDEQKKHLKTLKR